MELAKEEILIKSIEEILNTGGKLENVKNPDKLIGYYTSYIYKVLLILDASIGTSIYKEFALIDAHTEGCNTSSRVIVFNAFIKSIYKTVKDIGGK